MTTFRIDEGLDTGDVCWDSRRVAIAAGEHAPALLARLADAGAALLVETLGGLAGGLDPADAARSRSGDDARRSLTR